VNYVWIFRSSRDIERQTIECVYNAAARDADLLSPIATSQGILHNGTPCTSTNVIYWLQQWKLSVSRREKRAAIRQTIGRCWCNTQSN